MDNSSSICVSIHSHRCKLDNLPDLVYYHLLKHLDLDDIWSLRLINKRFYSIVKDHNIIELCFFDYHFCRELNFNWFSTTRPSKLENQLHHTKQGLLRNPSANLLNLKYLRIDVQSLDISLNDLNKFTKLQVLELRVNDMNGNHQLQLPDLKALSILISGGQYVLAIDTPKLHSLHIHNSKKDLLDDKIKFSHPCSIKRLILDKQDKKMSIFKNLESLEILNLYDLSNVVTLKSDLLKFNCLKKLKLWDPDSDIYDELISELKDLFKSKKDGLEMVLYGVPIKEISKFDEFGYEDMDLKFQLNNYNELEGDLYFNKYFDYEDLVRLFPNNEPADLFTKFTNIQIILIFSRIEDQDRLIRFMRKCKNLNDLTIWVSSFSQEFYDQLPSSLSQLTIKEDEKDLNLDFKFLLNMPYLNYLFIDQDVPLDEELSLNSFKRLTIFNFQIKDKDFQITKYNKDVYSVKNCESLGLPDQQYYTHHELVRWSNWLRDD